MNTPQTKNYRKKLNPVLASIVGRTEFKKVKVLPNQASLYDIAIKRATLIAKDDSLPLITKEQLVIDSLEGVIPNLIPRNTSKLSDVIERYISSLSCSKREIADRNYFLSYILINNTNIRDIKSFKYSDIKLLQKRFQSVLTPQGRIVSTRTVNKYITWLKNFFLYCLNEGLIDSNPAQGVKALKTEGNTKSQREALCIEEIKLLLNKTENDSVRFMIRLCYLTGMRLSEFKKARLAERDGVLCFDLTKPNSPLKTKSSYRIVPVHPDLLASLDTLKLLTDNDIELIARRIKRLIDKYLTVDTSKKTCYSLRHSFATDLINNNIDSNVVSELMGHSHNTMTLSRYSKGYSVHKLFESISSLSL